MEKNQDEVNEEIVAFLRENLYVGVQSSSGPIETSNFTLLEDNSVGVGVLVQREADAPAGIVFADPNYEKMVVVEIQSVLEIIKFATPLLVATEILIEADPTLNQYEQAEKIVLKTASKLQKNLEALGVYKPSNAAKKRGES